MSEIEPELKELVDELVAYDQSLTPEERAAERKSDRLSMYVAQLERQLEMVRADYPETLLSMNAFNNYQVACSLWPAAMANRISQDFIEQTRKRSRCCVMCGADLPMPYSDNNCYCKACDKECDDLEDSLKD